MRLIPIAAVAGALALAAAGCGGKDEQSATPVKTVTVAARQPVARTTGVIDVRYDPPATPDAQAAQQILSLGGTDGVAKGLSHSFKLPADLHIHVVNEDVGPNYQSATKTITLSYPFAAYVGQTLKGNFPELTDDEYGREWAATDAFILMHEMAHAFIDVYGFPVLGKEEDAADSLATVFLLRQVKGGDGYAFDAARFFHALSARQRKLAPSDYWDEHSLDQQRAYSIVCWIAGSSEERAQSIASLQLLPESRLAGCPAEYEQKVKAWEGLLRPHARA